MTRRVKFPYTKIFVYTMKSFSQRQGLKPIRTIIQRESADEVLRNALWNALTIFYFNEVKFRLDQTNEEHSTLIKRIWTIFYQERLDELDNYSSSNIRKIKNNFLTSEWYEMFDVLEFIPNHFTSFNNPQNAVEHNNSFFDYTNKVLKSYLSAYRFIDNIIVEVSSEEEIIAIEDALSIDSKYKPVQIHLKRALELFSDRQNPDYRNSIKESISAIESFCCIVTNNPKTTLGMALKEIEKKFEIHSALKSSFLSLYGYTSDENGIRHSLLEESTLKQEDAKFMLVTCSAFVNYLLIKTSEV
jgi:AbiJ N-terminal domain 4